MSHKTLWDMQRGDACKVTSFSAELAMPYQNRMIALGFRPDAIIRCTSGGNFSSPKSFQVQTTIYSVEQAVAELINIVCIPKHNPI